MSWRIFQALALNSCVSVPCYFCCSLIWNSSTATIEKAFTSRLDKLSVWAAKTQLSIKDWQNKIQYTFQRTLCIHNLQFDNKEKIANYLPCIGNVARSVDQPTKRNFHFRLLLNSISGNPEDELCVYEWT